MLSILAMPGLRGAMMVVGLQPGVTVCETDTFRGCPSHDQG